MSLIFLLLLAACSPAPTATVAVDTAPPPTFAAPSRLDSIPTGAAKLGPAEDAWPPVVASGLSQPQPLGGSVNTAGAEDSPFLTPDGLTLYFVFLPDPAVPPEQQLFDGVSGIWASQRSGDGWSEPVRIRLAEPNELTLDGCPTVLDDQLWFCSARQGNFRDVDLWIATGDAGAWTGWQNAGQQLNADYQVGELHFSADGQTMVFSSTRPGGLGGRDLWLTAREGEGWSQPVNLGAPLNTAGDENRPYLSPDGSVLYYDGPSQLGYPGPAIFRSTRQPDGSWSQPEELISQFAGEPTLSADGHTLYFVHAYFAADLSRMLESDIYVVEIP